MIKIEDLSFLISSHFTEYTEIQVLYKKLNWIKKKKSMPENN